MKITTTFIDTSAWLAIIDPSNPDHFRAKTYFEYLLERDAKLVTNNIVIDETLDALKQIQGVELAAKFNQIVDEALLTIKLRMDWISRRIRRTAINNFLRSSNPSLRMRHFFIKETLKRKKVDIIFSFDQTLSEFNLPLMPQAELK
ncbi:MAG TPA: PIN domain-containing protein [Caldithrix abyssi]|uniref:PIN domain-containing protein n=1 Tax=Caldithrix abyssi TaxID=187145 RepID=A0A7V5H2X5_CALAY|nr:type II toxin-antitoxin system VapC family toxin [Caldisericaceae bacterium]HHE54780.1 PIN domain-containing protein [Caldithrix abyssi]